MTRAILRIILGHLGSELDSFRIREKLKDQGFWFIDGRMWPALRALEREGLVHRREGERVAARGGLPRQWFSLTTAGERAARWVP